MKYKGFKCLIKQYLSHPYFIWFTIFSNKMKNTTIPGNPIGNRRNEGKIDTPGIHDHSENTPGIHDHSENTSGIHDHSGENPRYT
jgi:hypothetical protein